MEWDGEVSWIGSLSHALDTVLGICKLQIVGIAVYTGEVYRGSGLTKDRFLVLMVVVCIQLRYSHFIREKVYLEFGHTTIVVYAGSRRRTVIGLDLSLGLIPRKCERVHGPDVQQS